jgi:hypothetical protein
LFYKRRDNNRPKKVDILTTNLPLLPNGQSDFESVRLDNAVYVDKTAYIPKLRKRGKIIFCSRPRRFGKSLLCSTLDAYFSGKEELFQGLAAAKDTRAKEFVPKPVIFMDMSRTAGCSSKTIFESALLELLRDNAARHDVDIRGANAPIAFNNLIQDVYRKYSQSRVVVIIDEYACPIVHLAETIGFSPERINVEDNISNPFKNDLERIALSTINAMPDESPDKAKLLELYLESKQISVELEKISSPSRNQANAEKQSLKDTRETMESFYSQIQASNEFLDFVFITGIVKYSSAGLFSALREINDITLEPEFGALFGFTQNEVEIYFAPFIENVGKKLNLAKDVLLKRVKDYYYGFSFDGKEKLYNPQTLLFFLSSDQFFNFWMSSGSNNRVQRLLMEKNFQLNIEEADPFDINYISNPGPIETVSSDLYLYQSGYLTIRENGDGTYNFDYPNYEVSASMNLLFMENLYNSRLNLQSAMIALKDILIKGNVPELTKLFREIFSNINFMNYKQMTRDNTGQSFYRNILMAFMKASGVQVSAEKRANFRRARLVARYKNRVYVIEVETACNDHDARQTIGAGLSQIVKGKYVGPLSDPIVLLLVALEKERNIAAYVFWREGKTEDASFLENGKMTLPPRQD